MPNQAFFGIEELTVGTAAEFSAQYLLPFFRRVGLHIRGYSLRASPAAHDSFRLKAVTGGCYTRIRPRTLASAKSS